MLIRPNGWRKVAGSAETRSEEGGRRRERSQNKREIGTQKEDDSVRGRLQSLGERRTLGVFLIKGELERREKR